jgi:aminoglycoside 6'-N-acetyltransferase
MALVEGDLIWRELRAGDEQRLIEMFEEPEVKRWWPVPDYGRESGWVIELAGEPVGWLEYHEEAYHWYPSVAFDIVLRSRLHGRGYGRRALSLAIEHFVAKGHHRFTLDPNIANERAIRSYRAVGFERVGVMRAYERDPAGGWNDALLMELIVAAAAERDARGFAGDERRA